jgi:mono/diheme cytochrome c family protein/predicted  nucleic acid-binding Zn-ribbon protein
VRITLRKSRKLPDKAQQIDHRNSVKSSASLACLLIAAACAASIAQGEDKVTYDDHVAAIFRARCSTCHNPTAKKADLDVTNYLKLMQGGASGASVTPGDADSSYLFSLVARTSQPYMPQNADKLPDAEIDLLRRWINGGALENAGSKAAKPKPKIAMSSQGASSKRPDVIPMPPHMVLEPAFRTAHPTMARSLATSPWAPLVAVTGQKQVLLYNTKTLDLLGVYPFPEGQPNVVRFSRDGKLLLAGGGQPAASGKVVVWDIATGDRVFEIGKELDAVLAADISADHKLIALGGPQRVVRVYSTETGELKYELTKHTEWVLTAEFSPDGVLLATSDRNGGLFVWEADTGHEYLTLAGHTAAVNAIEWRDDSNILASASEDATVCLWEMENGTAVKKWNAKTPLTSLDFTRNGQLITGGRDGVLRWWKQDGQQGKETKPIGDLAVSVAYCDEADRAIMASWSGATQVYKPDDGAVVGSLITNPSSLGERLVAAETALQQKTAAAAPLAEVKRRAEEENTKADTAFKSAQQQDSSLQAKASALAAEVQKTSQARTAAEAERAKTSTTISQNEAARPLVGEALRQVVEAVSKAPNDQKLASVQKQLTEQLKTMERSTADLNTKIAELNTNIVNADAQLKTLNAQLESVNKESASASEKLKGLQSQSEQAAKSLAAAQKAVSPAEAALAACHREVARWKDEIAFRDQIASLQSELDSANKVVAARQADLDKANKQLADVQSNVNAVKKQFDAAAGGADAVTAKIRAARSSSPK